MISNSSSERSVILVVDDNQTNLDVMFDLLRHSGFKVLVAIDGESAIEQLEYIKPDLIILDVMMPGIDGFETCQRLKEDPQTQDIPIIFMTALSDTRDKVYGFKMGAVDYITKPFQHEEVLVRVKTHLTICQLQKQLQEKNKELESFNLHLEKLVEQKTKLLISQEKSALIGRLTKGMVHNLRSPLQVIQTGLELIDNVAKKIGEQSILNYSQYIHQSVQKIDEMMGLLMIKARKDSRDELTFANINELLERELRLLEANLQFKNKVKKTYIFDKTIAEIPIIDAHVSQVFHNLIDNAMDAMWNMKKQELIITTRQDEEAVYIDIQDTGCGIESDNLAKIFDPFYTSKPTKGEEEEKGMPTGTGLGLYSCLELLNPFCGDIVVSSEVGKGSIFTIILQKNPPSLPHQNSLVEFQL